MMVTLDIRPWSWDIVEYISLHLQYICYDDDASHDSAFFNPCQVMVFDELLWTMFLTGQVEDHLPAAVSNIYVALYPKYPEVGILGLTMMMEEVVQTETFQGLLCAIDRALSAVGYTRDDVFEHRVRNRLSTLTLKLETGS